MRPLQQILRDLNDLDRQEAQLAQKRETLNEELKQLATATAEACKSRAA